MGKDNELSFGIHQKLLQDYPSDQQNKKSRQKGHQVEDLFEKNTMRSPVHVHSNIDDMDLVFDDKVCRSVNPIIALGSSEAWPANSIPSAWHASYPDSCRQSPILTPLSIEGFGFIFKAEIYQSAASVTTLESSETLPVHLISGAGPKNGNDYC